MTDIRFEDLGDGRFALHGDLTYDTVSRALDLSKQVFADHASIELDLTDIANGDSAGLALLLEWVNWAKNYVREIRFVSVPDSISDIARISEVEDMLSRGERWTGVGTG